MLVRFFEDKDAEELSVLIKTTLVTSNSEDYSDKAIRVLCDAYSPDKLVVQSKKADVFVASQNGKLIGTISLDEDLITVMFVLPEYQKKGIGRELLEYVEQQAKKKGIKFLKVRASLTAYKFYEKNGYSKIKNSVHKLIGPLVWMEKEL